MTLELGLDLILQSRSQVLDEHTRIAQEGVFVVHQRLQVIKILADVFLDWLDDDAPTFICVDLGAIK